MNTFCTECGAKLEVDDKFCIVCGTEIEGVVEENEYKTTDEQQKKERLQKLKKYKEIQNCTCLECGYTGLMGVEGTQKKSILSIIVGAILCALAIWFCGWFGILMGVIGFVLSLIGQKKVLFCPNCEKIIYQK